MLGSLEKVHQLAQVNTRLNSRLSAVTLYMLNVASEDITGVLLSLCRVRTTVLVSTSRTSDRSAGRSAALSSFYRRDLALAVDALWVSLGNTGSDIPYHYVKR